MKERQDKILTVLPAYNEEKHLKQVLEQVLEQTPDVLVVNDGSKDRTADIARECGVMLITRENNLGKGASLKEAFNRALELGYDAVIMLDADGQHDPACIPEFVEKFHETRAPLIIGCRNYEEMPFRRRIPNLIGKALFSTAVGQEIPDNQSGYRLLDRVMMNRMLASNERGYHFEVVNLFSWLIHYLNQIYLYI